MSVRPTVGATSPGLAPMVVGGALFVLAGACASQSIPKECTLFAKDYDFSHHEVRTDASTPEYAPASDLLIRYLGARGVYLEWQGQGVLVSPHFTAYPERANRSRLAPDVQAIEEGLAELDTARVQAVLVGSADHLHLGDLVEVAKRLPNADLYVNDEAKLMLAPHEADLEHFAPDGSKKVKLRSFAGRSSPRLHENWGWLRGAKDEKLPIRVMALPTAKPAVSLQEPWETPWTEARLRDFTAGTPYAFVVEFTDPSRSHVLVRALVVDEGEVPTYAAGAKNDDDLAVLDERQRVDWYREHVDVVVLTVQRRSEQTTDRLARLRVGHVVMVGYEDDHLTPAGTLSVAKALPKETVRTVICRTDAVMANRDGRANVPKNREADVEGPYGERWTMPLPGEWLVFGAGAPRRLAKSPRMQSDVFEGMGPLVGAQGPAPSADEILGEDEELLILDDE